MKITSAIIAALFAATLSFSASACNSNDDDQAAYSDTDSLSSETLERIRSAIIEE